MSLSPLLPIAGAVLAPIAERALDGLASGLSFLDVLRQQESQQQAVEQAGSSGPRIDLDQFLKQLRARFSSLGIDPATPIRLKQDGDGGVIVDGDHADRVLIEGLFATDEELTEQFNGLAIFAAAEQQLDDDYTAEDFRMQIDSLRAAIDFA